MKILLSVIMFVTLLISPVFTNAQEKKLATDETLSLMKKDILDGVIKVGITRLSQVSSLYGDAPNIIEADKSVTYEYDDIKLEFDKFKYFRKWQYDFSHKPAYSDYIKKLRKDLEAGQLLPGYKTLDLVIKDYKEPTEGFEASGDGKLSVYYWGEVRLSFENVIILKKWTGKNLEREVANQEATITMTKDVPVKPVETAK
ncbi:MAG: hypothetical protein HQL27_05810 [Candidatus Omnitrophica bacterium]|nr:hypothetical protein [Candidatus Omnitrophota bacterium]